jgi:hypothetical protein
VNNHGVWFGTCFQKRLDALQRLQVSDVTHRDHEILIQPLHTLCIEKKKTPQKRLCLKKQQQQKQHVVVASRGDSAARGGGVAGARQNPGRIDVQNHAPKNWDSRRMSAEFVRDENASDVQHTEQPGRCAPGTFCVDDSTPGPIGTKASTRQGQFWQVLETNGPANGLGCGADGDPGLRRCGPAAEPGVR